jgi:hypothetical protein
VTPTKELTDNDAANLVKIASYRALVGKQAAEIRKYRDALRNLRDECAPGTTAETIITAALSEAAP